MNVWKNTKKIEFAVNVIGTLFATVIGVLTLFSGTGNEENTVIDDSFNTTINNYFHQYNFEANDNVSVETQLFKAEAAYDSKDYQKLFEIYASSTLADNPIANSNLGYLYANGIYVDKSLKIAEQYYDKAINTGFDRAYTNKLAMYLNNPEEYFDQTVDLIEECFNRNIDNVALFIGSHLSGSTDIKACKMDLKKFCNSFTQAEQEDLIENVILSFESAGRIKTSSTLSSSRFIYYSYICSQFEYNSYGNQVLYNYFEKSVKKPRNISLSMKHSFVKIWSNNAAELPFALPLCL